LFILSCASNKIQQQNFSNKYKIHSFKSKSGLSTISIDNFHDTNSGQKDWKALAFININGVLLENKIINNKMDPYYTKVESGKKYDILVYSPGLLPLRMNNLKIKKGDSLVIKTYLKEDNRPLH
jgi:hypothetical protein